MKPTISIVFFGSGPVALKSLLLLANDFSIEAIITKPSTASDMQQALSSTPVLAVSNRQELDSLLANQHHTSTVAILIDFGIIVSQQVIDSFPNGIINSHFSLLPEWRGADPITFSLLSGQQQTGISLMLLTKGMDEGLILSEVACNISERMTTPQLTELLVQTSSDELKRILPAYLSGEIKLHTQEAANPHGITTPTYSRKLIKEDGIIDWHKPANILEREVRAYITWPKSRTTMAGREIIITDARVSDKTLSPGAMYIETHRLFVGCGKGSLELMRLKPVGKSEMSAAAFLAGYKQFL